VKFVRIALTARTNLRLWLGYSSLGTICGPGKDVDYPENNCHALAFVLTNKYLRSDVENLARVLGGIERARKKLFQIAEEGTRTGPA
jgi:hypothetical protein